nr:MAG TPA: hypothetical protein [Caudoviricetes sp.]
MKNARMIIGIISIILFVLVALQSCAAGIVNTIEGAGETSGSAGIIVAIFLLTAGIIGVAGKKSKGAAITSGCFYGFGGLVGLSNVGKYYDLKIWSVLSLIFAVVFIMTAIFDNRKKKDPTTE